jgi:hypothetical protein
MHQLSQQLLVAFPWLLRLLVLLILLLLLILLVLRLLLFLLVPVLSILSHITQTIKIVEIQACNIGLLRGCSWSSTMTLSQPFTSGTLASHKK